MDNELLGMEDEALGTTEFDEDAMDSDEDYTEAEDDTDEADDPEEGNDEEDDTSTEESKHTPLFDEKQQAEVNKLIKARLDRQDTKFVRELSNVAGVEIAHEEISNAARLWGLLKANPELSKNVDGLIAVALTKGEATEPSAKNNSVDAVTQRLELKEAILDLRASDSTFGKNANKILAWAENEGYEVTNSKALKMAYLAWKGSQGKITEAVQKSTAKRKQDAKKEMQRRATVQSTKSGTHTGGSDYRRMSDSAILASEGMNLFTDD